ncbi:MAG: hypothetical protein CMJ18_03630 [Phycisphaeraceae bacterium]|nr:hypothetical protein [Phycisphaeraceae bacterium]
MTALTHKRKPACRAALIVHIVTAMIGSGPLRAEPIGENLVVRHDFFRGTGEDLTGNGRDARIGLGAVQLPRFVWLGGEYEKDSRVSFASAGRDGRTLERTIAVRGGDATIEIWFEGVELEHGDYLLFDGRGHRPGEPERARGCILRLEVPVGRADVGMALFDRQGREHDIVNGGTPVSTISTFDKEGRLNINRLRQYVYVLDGNQPDGNGKWSMYIDGAPVGIAPAVYRTSVDLNVFTLGPGQAQYTIAGRQSDRYNQASPRGRLYRMLIYDRALGADEVASNRQTGLAAITGADAKPVAHEVASAPPDAEALVLVDEGRPHAVIAIAAHRPRAVEEAAAALHNTIFRMTGVRLPIVEQTQVDLSAPVRPAVLLVGPSPLTDRLGIDVVQNRDHEHDHYVIRTGDRWVALVGNDDLNLRGSAYAVYDLLQRLGCGWFGQDEAWHVIPRVRKLVVPPMNVDERAAFRFRSLSAPIRAQCVRDAWRIGGRAYAIDHALDHLVPRREHLEAHPDWFGPGQPCMTHPDVVDLIASKFCMRIDRTPGNQILSLCLMVNDNANFCRCDRCAKLGNHGELMLHFANEVARRLAATHAGRYQITNLAYWATFDLGPDSTSRAEPGVSVQTLHQGNRAKPIEHESNAAVRAAMYNWSRTGAEMAVYDWWIPGFKHSAHWRKVPWYPGETTLRDYRFWKKHGVRYVFHESNREAGDGLPIRWPLWYVGARGLWNPDVRAETVMSEACNKLFASAAPHMLGFYALLEKAMADTDQTASVWNLPPPHLVYTTPIQARAGALLSAAADASDDPRVLARIEDERKMWKGATEVMAAMRAAEEKKTKDTSEQLEDAAGM